MITITFQCTANIARQLLEYYEGLIEPEESETEHTASQDVQSWRLQFTEGLFTLNLPMRIHNALYRGILGARPGGYSEPFMGQSGSLLSFDEWTKRIITDLKFRDHVLAIRMMGEKSMHELITAIEQRAQLEFPHHNSDSANHKRGT